MAKNNLSVQYYGSYDSIEDHRWRVSTTGVSDAQNGDLIIDDAAKAEGTHRKGGWLLSGTPLYRDENNKLKVFSAEAKAAGSKIFGFLMSPAKIVDVNGAYYDTIPVAVQTSGEIIAQWLPVKVDPADIPVNVINTVL